MNETPTQPTDEGVWERLRRRKVVQWGAAYVAGAWALLQGIDFLVDAFHWPDAAKQIATIALVIGLPVALVLAWYHGDRGQQRVGGTELTILAALLGLGGFLLWRYEPAIETPTTATATTRHDNEEETHTSEDAALNTAARNACFRDAHGRASGQAPP